MKHLRKILALILCLVLCVNMNITSSAVNENNNRGVIFSATLDKPTITTSEEEQTVTMTLSTNQAITVDGIGFTVTWDEPLTWTAIDGGSELGEYDSVSTNYENGKTAWYSSDAENVTGVTELAAISFTVPANIPAGTYNVGVENLELTQDYGEIWENAAQASAVLTVTDSESIDGYGASVTTLTNEVTIGDAVAVNVGVSHSQDVAFAAAEVVVSYDEAFLSFNKDASTLGTATVKEETGKLTLEDYGADKNFGTGVYILVFDTVAVGNANIILDSAKFIDKEDAVKSDLLSATLSQASVAVTINKPSYNITLPDIFQGYDSVIENEDYTFSLADGKNYDYTSISATMNGVDVPVIDNGDGTYTIENVTGDLVITGTRTEKNYAVTISGNAAEDITDAANTATYNTDYTFTMPSAEGWAYGPVSITIGGENYTGYTVENSVYTIPGSAISGDIVINVSKSQTIASVVVEGTGAGTAVGYETSANIGEAYTLTIVPEAGYVYTVTATMNGESVEVVDNNNNTYTIEQVSGNVVFNIKRTVIVDGVSVSEYLTLDGSVMWLVKNDVTLAEGKVPTYNDEKMFWSEEYGTYCYLVISETLAIEDVTAKINITDGTAVSVDYGMDVNNTGRVDASDAQITYNMYNAMYSNFSVDATIEKFLRADVNADGKVNVNDATAIIAKILA